mmetsp:Transcript_15284/g.28538  ORF Transcript_15284/g.28538 Transcript_15284/m.28538 type:complete len:209 (-) Transcript_15284:1181-1807(-)
MIGVVGKLLHGSTGRAAYETPKFVNLLGITYYCQRHDVVVHASVDAHVDSDTVAQDGEEFPLHEVDVLQVHVSSVGCHHPPDLGEVDVVQRNVVPELLTDHQAHDEHALPVVTMQADLSPALVHEPYHQNECYYVAFASPLTNLVKVGQEVFDIGRRHDGLSGILLSLLTIYGLSYLLLVSRNGEDVPALVLYVLLWRFLNQIAEQEA